MGLNALMNVSSTHRFPITRPDFLGYLHNIVPQATTTRTSIDPQLYAEMKPKVATLVETLYHFNTSQAPDSIRFNVELTQTLLKDMNFIYPVRQCPSWSARNTTDPIPFDRKPGMADNVITRTATP